MPQAQIVTAVYKPHPGRVDELLLLLKSHVPTLRDLGLVSSNTAYVSQSNEGSIVEVFEWVSAEAAASAHDHPAVAQVWEKMAQCCLFSQLGSLPEASKPFPHFSVLWVH